MSDYQKPFKLNGRVTFEQQSYLFDQFNVPWEVSQSWTKRRASQEIAEQKAKRLIARQKQYNR